MRPIRIPPPVTTAAILETLRSSFDLADGLYDDVVLIMARVAGLEMLLGVEVGATVEEALVRSLEL